MSRPGLFIAFEGLDGAGKTTQVGRLAARLRSHGYEPLLVRPGDTPFGGMADRVLLAPRETSPLDPWTEALLFVAQRVQLWREVVEPALGSGQVVVVDRWVDSTYAYQGRGRGLDLSLLERLHGDCVAGALPDVTLYLRVSRATASARRRSDDIPLDRIASSDDTFFARVHDGFEQLAHSHPERIRSVDADRSPDDVAGQVWTAVAERLGSPRREL